MQTLSSLNKSIQKHNNLMDCQPYVKHRFRQKSERCFCISSGHRDQKGPSHFPRFLHGGSAGCIPRRRATYSTAGTACQGAMGDTSSRAAVDEAGKMGGSLLVTVSRRYTKTPLRFSGSGALRKVDSPLNCCAFVCSC